jgi:hypothetical protein
VEREGWIVLSTIDSIAVDVGEFGDLFVSGQYQHAEDDVPLEVKQRCLNRSCHVVVMMHC